LSLSSGIRSSPDALVVSLKTTLLAQLLILVFGTPTAYVLATRRFRGRAVKTMGDGFPGYVRRAGPGHPVRRCDP